MAQGIYVGSVYATFELNEKGVSQSIGNINSGLSSVGNSLNSVGQRFTLGVSAPIAAGLGVSTALFGDFDKTIRLAGVTMGATGQQADQLRELAKRMGAETAFSAQDAADALLELAKGGMSVAQIQGGALAETLKLASAGGLELGSAAQYVVKGLNMFGLEAKDAGRITTALAGGANASTASVDDLGLALSQVGPGVQLLGYNIEDTVAVLAEFANVGIRGSDAGTSLKTMLQRLSPQTKEAAEAMRGLGLNFFNAQGQALPLREVAQQLQDRLRGLTDEQKQNALTTIFGSDAYRAAAVLADGGAAAVDKYAAATRDSKAASDLAKAATEGQAGSIERAKGSLETAAITVGEKLAPSVIDMANAVNRAADAFGNLSPGVQDAIIKFAIFLAALGPILTVAGNVITFAGAVQKAFTVLGGLKAATSISNYLIRIGQGFADARVAASVFSGSAGTIGGVLRTLVGSFGTVVTVLRTVAVAIAGIVAGASAMAIAIGVAVALIIAGIIYVATHFDQTKKAVSDFATSAGNILSQWASNIANFFEPAISAVTGFFSRLGSTVGSIIGTVFAPVGAALGVLGAVFNSVFSTIGNIVTTVFSVIASFWTGILAPIFGLIGTTITAVGTIAFTIFSSIAQIVFTVVSTIVQIIGVVLYGSFLFLWNNVLVPTGKFFADVFSAVRDTVVSVLSFVGGFIVSTFTAIWAFLQPILQNVWNFIVTVFNGIRTAIVTAWQAVVDFTRPIIAAVVDFVMQRFNNLVSNVSYAFNLIRTYIINPVGDAVNYVRNTIGQVAGFVANALSNAYNAARDFVGRFTSAGRDIINGIVNGIQNGAGAVVQKIKDICSGALDSVKKFFGIKSPSRVMRTQGHYIMEGLSNGIGQAGRDTVATVQNISRQLLNAADTGNLFDNSFSGISAQAGSIFSNRGVAQLQPVAAGGDNGSFILQGDLNMQNPVSPDELIDALVHREFLEERGIKR